MEDKTESSVRKNKTMQHEDTLSRKHLYDPRKCFCDSKVLSSFYARITLFSLPKAGPRTDFSPA